MAHPVDVDETQFVGLKEFIAEEHILTSADAHPPTLYRTNIDIPEDG